MHDSILGIFKGLNSSKGKIDIEHNSKFELKNDERLFFINKVGDPSYFREDINFSNFVFFQKVKLSPLGEVLECKPRNRQPISLKSTPRNV